MRASVISPTLNRPHFHKNLYSNFSRQTSPDLELLVADDSPEESAFLRAAAAQDPRVRYFRVPTMSCGAKRNYLIGRARGEHIIHFDDDDYYAPHYIDNMLRQIGPGALVKLTGWFVYSPAHNFFGYWDTTTHADLHYHVTPVGMRVERRVQNVASMLGYGFSYAYRRDVANQLPFPDMTAGEDFQFVQTLIEAKHKLIGTADETRSNIHVVHGGNVSSVMPQFAMPMFLMNQLFPGVRADIDAAYSAAAVPAPAQVT